MISHKQMQPCAVGLHESMSASTLARDGFKQAVLHLAGVTKWREVLLVQKAGAWGFPRQSIRMSGTLISFPEKIITTELGFDPSVMRGGSNPACGDTKLLGQYIDDEGVLNIVMRITVARVSCEKWTLVTAGQVIGDDYDEAVQLSAVALDLRLSADIEQVA